MWGRLKGLRRSIMRAGRREDWWSRGRRQVSGNLFTTDLAVGAARFSHLARRSGEESGGVGYALRVSGFVEDVLVARIAVDVH